MTLPDGLEAAIEDAVADGSIFSDSHHDEPAPFDRIAPALREQTKVMWVCSCGEMWAGTDIERDVHVHAAFEGGTHRVEGPLFKDHATEAEVRTAWAEEDRDGE